MRSLSQILLTGLVLVSACGPSTGQAVPEPARQSMSVDRPPLSRCMNLSGALEANFEGEWGYTIRFGHIDAIAAAGFDAIRLPVRWSAHVSGADHRIDPDMLARVDAIIAHARSRGLAVVLDVHHFEAMMADPLGQLPVLEAIWRQLATHYADVPADGLVFEILNEPTDRVSAAEVDRINARLLPVIRAVSPERWVILTSARWNNIDGLEQAGPLPSDPRVMMTVHYYAPFDFTHQGAPWSNRTETGISWGGPRDELALAEDFEAIAAQMSARNVPVLLGEFGVYAGVPEHLRARWVSAVRDAAEMSGLSWCHWGFASTLRSYDPAQEAWIPAMRDALIPGSD
ncbi:glycoside hydrolase family 5 protein [Maricaulis alexandrii]|uniref:glycoside hydrolase family 5 protein n=1 Tax=Maricaulis alexandrii TaxID=2570354 RepID=UPI0011086036|nr:glycoside hydrolase family 5 protein [Maricaulis alexandrii]